MLRATVILSAVLLPMSMSPGQALQPGFDQVAIGNVGATRAWGVGVADFNSDDLPDIVSGNTYGDVHLFVADSNGNFTDQGVVVDQLWNDAYALAVGDFDGDENSDFVLARTTDANDGQILLYRGNGNGTFQTEFIVGDAGTDPLTLTAGDVDGDGDVDLISGEIYTGTGDTADVILWRNDLVPGGSMAFAADPTPVIAAENVQPPTSESLPPYYPPSANLHAYGLALGDMDNDTDLDLLVGDKAHYLYVYRNDGSGSFSPIRYENVTDRPYAYQRLESLFNEGMPIAVGDFNDDGWTDFVTGFGGATGNAVSLWVNEGLDGSGRPVFTGAGVVGSADTQARGLASGQLNPLVDDDPDVVFGTFEGNLYSLLVDIADSDLDGIIDADDNAPDHSNAPRIDMNTDGGINHLDQLDNDHDGVGDPADDDDDNDGVLDVADNSPFVSNADQADSDGDGTGDVSDPLNDTDSDNDGVTDGPFDAALRARAMDAKGRWSRNDTHFIIRIDALGRAFQNEFTQTLTDGAILTPAEWELEKNRNYNGIGDEPAVDPAPGDPNVNYTFPVTDPPLVGGADCPLTLVVIPKLLWNAFGDDDPIAWINERLGNPNLEIGQHGSYHFNNTPLGDWKDLTDRNFYASESAGLTLEENYQLLRIGQRTLLGQYADDQWILDSGVDPVTATKIDWTGAANPLISYAPPYNTSDTISRDATARLGYRGFSASIVEEQGSLAKFFTPPPEESHHEMIDQFGMFHASADREVESEVPSDEPPGTTYADYLNSITESPGLNTWLIEEVEWSTRYCNDLDRLVTCPITGELNRENNMVDPDRWRNWMALLNHAKANGEVMTMGDYALAMQFDNAPTVPNPDQADADHDGIGDVIDDATINVVEVQVDSPASGAEATLTATLLNGSSTGIPGQTIVFFIDTDGDGTEEQHTATTDANGVASVVVTVSGGPGTVFLYRATWDGGPVNLEAAELLRVGDPVPLRIIEVNHMGSSVEFTVEGLDPLSTYRLGRSADLLGFPHTVVSGFAPAGSPDTLSDDDPPAEEAYYRLEEE